MGLKLNPWGLSSFSALTLLVGHLTRKNPSPIRADMTYNVFSRTLNLA